MTRNRLITIAIFAGSALLAQAQSNGGWRRATDQPPSSPEAQDPTQPVERMPVDEYGNAQQRNDRPAYGLPAQLVIKPGTFVTVRINQGLNSDRNQQGDLFTATLMQPVVVDGVVVAQQGQTVMGRVAEAHKAGRVEGTSRLRLQLTALTLADGTQANVESALVTRNGRSDVGSDVATVATTTGVGAAIGAAADWGRGAAIGAGAGAAAGLIGVLLTRGHPTIVYTETVLTFQLGSAVAVNTTRAPYAYRYIGPEDYNRPTEARMMQPRPMPVPAPGPYYYGPGPYYPYYGYPYYGGFGFGVVVRGGGHWRRFR